MTQNVRWFVSLPACPRCPWRPRPSRRRQPSSPQPQCPTLLCHIRPSLPPLPSSPTPPCPPGGRNPPQQGSSSSEAVDDGQLPIARCDAWRKANVAPLSSREEMVVPLPSSPRTQAGAGDNRKTSGRNWGNSNPKSFSMVNLFLLRNLDPMSSRACRNPII